MPALHWMVQFLVRAWQFRTTDTGSKGPLTVYGGMALSGAFSGDGFDTEGNLY